MRKADHTARQILRVATILVAPFILASCAGSDFQFPWSKTPEPVTEAPPPPQPKPATKDDIRKIQSGLARLGYRPGPADGVPGRKTIRSIRQYQKKYGLPEDGEATVALLVHIETNLERKLPSRPEGPALALPAYTTGAEYIYQNGEVDRVESVKKNRVKWRRSSGETIVAVPNFMLPRTYWETKTKRGRSVVTDGDGVWPTKTNETRSFHAVKTIIEGNDEKNMKTRKEDWNCVNEGRSRLSVIAGVFETVRFVCTRADEAKDNPARRIWHYAPDIRHYVRLDEFRSDQPNAHRRELVAIRPSARTWPPVARAALEQRLIAALNETPIGGKAEWKSSGIPTSVTVRIIAEYFDPMGRQCRQYLQEWSEGRTERLYPGVACREKTGDWRLPVSAGPTTASLAVASHPGS